MCADERPIKHTEDKSRRIAESDMLRQHERLKVLKLGAKPPEDYECWTAYALCEAYAIKRNFRTKKGRPDTYKAGNMILRMIFSGDVLLAFDPPDNKPKEAKSISSFSTTTTTFTE